MQSYYLYLNGVMPENLKFEFYENNFVYSLPALDLAKDEKFKREYALFETFRDHEFLVIQITDSRFHDLFKLATLLTTNNMWPFKYFICFSNENIDSNFPLSISMFPEIANQSLVYIIALEQHVTRFQLKDLEFIHKKIQKIILFLSKNPEFNSIFFNTKYFIENSYSELKRNSDTPKSIVNLMAAYESLLNFNSNESIVKSISKRIDYIGKNNLSSKHFVALYNLRSKYIHGNINDYIKKAANKDTKRSLNHASAALIQLINLIIDNDISYKELQLIKHFK
jgi:hypothetical protein